MHKALRAFTFYWIQLCDSHGFEPPIPAVVAALQAKDDFLDKSVLDAGVELVLPGEHSICQHDDIQEDLAKLENRHVVDWCAARGWRCFTTLLISGYSLSVRSAHLTSDAEEKTNKMHKAFRFLEVLLPRTSPELLHWALRSSLNVSQHLDVQIFSEVHRTPTNIAEDCMRPVDVVLTIVGADFGVASLATVSSLVHHTSRSLRIFVVGDIEGWLAFSSIVSAKTPRVECHFVNIETNSAYSAIWEQFPGSCFDAESGTRRIWENPGLIRARLAVLFLADLLPHVDKIISLDVGDLLVLRDIDRLHAMFDWFNPEQLFAAAWEVGPMQIRHDVSTGDVHAPTFWARKGLPLIRKGLNTGVVLFNLARLRSYLLNGTTIWNDAIIDVAHRVSDHWCGLAIIGEQAILSSFIFTHGEKYFYELSSRWNYIPIVPWELASYDANASGMPLNIMAMKLFPGISPGGRLKHPCPGYAELLAEVALAHETSDEFDLWLNRARQYFHWFNTLGAPGLYSSDTKCGGEVWIVHLAGYTKLLPWARRLLRFWANPS